MREAEALWGAVCVIVGLIVGIGAGFLGWLSGQQPPAAISTGALALAGAVGVALLIRQEAKASPLSAVISVIVSVIVAVAAGVLGWLDGQEPPTAILTAGAAFGGAVFFIILVKRAFTSSSSPDDSAPIA
jgi:hypothetical protein